jgi:hypothetical protein
LRTRKVPEEPDLFALKLEPVSEATEPWIKATLPDSELIPLVKVDPLSIYVDSAIAEMKQP